MVGPSVLVVEDQEEVEEEVILVRRIFQIPMVRM